MREREPRVGVVVIGRNEGERLRACLRSLDGCGSPVVYVDSGSTDGSVALARSAGVDVLELSPTVAFTVARARNEGLERLVSLAPGVHVVQFADADCTIASGWIDRATREIERRPDVAAIGGHRRERFPEASVYNTLFDMEWQRPAGECVSCGGDALIRVAAFRDVGGYDAGLIGGTDPEFSFRLRRKGWRILQIDAEMTEHDAHVFRFRQWWNRGVRTGYSYAEGAALHGRGPERYQIRHVASALVWGLAAPVLAATSVVASVWQPGLLALATTVVFGYAVVFGRIYGQRRALGNAPRLAALFAAFCLLSKVSHVLGVFRFLRDRILGRRGRLIEYKSLASRG